MNAAACEAQGGASGMHLPPGDGNVLKKFRDGAAERLSVRIEHSGLVPRAYKAGDCHCAAFLSFALALHYRPDPA
jgi:hypothetical protein